MPEESDREDRALQQLRALGQIPSLRPGGDVHPNPLPEITGKAFSPPKKPGVMPEIRAVIPGVLSTYNIRPENSHDWFMPIGIDTLNSGQCFGSIDFPAGYVGVLGRVTVQAFADDFLEQVMVRPAPTSNPRIVIGHSTMPDIFHLENSTVTINSGSAIAIGSLQDQFIDQPAHIIIPENSTMFFGVTGLPLSIALVRWELYGQLLLSRGRLANQEIKS